MGRDIRQQQSNALLSSGASPLVVHLYVYICMALYMYVHASTLEGINLASCLIITALCHLQSINMALLSYSRGYLTRPTRHLLSARSPCIEAQRRTRRGSRA